MCSGNRSIFEYFDETSRGHLTLLAAPSYSEAVNDPTYVSKWKETIHKELSTSISFGTWELITQKEAEGTISSTRWLFDVKLVPDGRIDCFKARLVVRGNEQSDDDFDETFAPVLRIDRQASTSCIPMDLHKIMWDQTHCNKLYGLIPPDTHLFSLP